MNDQDILFDLLNKDDCCFFFEPDEVICVWIVGWVNNLYGYFTRGSFLHNFRMPKEYVKAYVNMHKLDRCVLDWAEPHRLHYVKGGMLPTNKVVTHLKYFQLDLDVDSDLPSSGSEIERAYEQCLTMIQWCEDNYHLRNPTKCMSGNGIHLLFRAPGDWVNDAKHQFWYKSFQKAAEKYFIENFPDNKTIVLDKQKGIVRHKVKLDPQVSRSTTWMKLWHSKVHTVREYTMDDLGFIDGDKFRAFMFNKVKYEELSFNSDDPDQDRVPRECHIIKLGSNHLEEKESYEINRIFMEKHKYVKPSWRPSKGDFPVEKALDQLGVGYEEPEYSQIYDSSLWKLTDGCPFNPKHKDAAIIYRSGMPVPIFKCFHNSCSNYSWVYFKIILGDNDEEEK